MNIKNESSYKLWTSILLGLSGVMLAYYALSGSDCSTAYNCRVNIMVNLFGAVILVLPIALIIAYVIRLFSKNKTNGYFWFLFSMIVTFVFGIMTLGVLGS